MNRMAGGKVLPEAFMLKRGFVEIRISECGFDTFSTPNP
jgi:hypothetical protein